MASHDSQMEPNTVAHKVYKQLRFDIINGIFPPGTHLVKRTIAQKYGVSVPPVIEACLRLENDGLVENSPQLGSFVPKNHPEKLEEEHIFREAIECQIARVYAVRASNQDRETMMRLAEAIDKIEREDDLAEAEKYRAYQHLHLAYHVTLAKLCRVKLLFQQVEKVWFRRLMLLWNVDKKRFPTPPDWHVVLTNALNSGNPDRAEAAMREHFNVNTAKKTEVIPQNILESSTFFDELLSSLPPGTVDVVLDPTKFE